MKRKDNLNRISNNKKNLVFPLIIMFFLFFISFTSSLTSISNCTQLQDMNNNLVEDYELSNNIDCSDTINWNNGSGFLPIGNETQPFDFQGNLNGNNFNISNLYINRPSMNSIGLISFSQTGISNINNLGLININITGAGNVGGLIGYKDDGRNIINSFVIGTINANGGNVGGLVGLWESGGIINNSYFIGNVNGTSRTGGLIGNANDIFITNSYSKGNVNGTTQVGGLVGFKDGQVTSNSYSNSNVNGNSDYIGGLIGYSTFATLINNSYATGNIDYADGGGALGGLVGGNDNGLITFTYSTGFVNTTDASIFGGLIGDDNTATPTTDSYFDLNTSGTSSGAGTPKTTAEMKNQSTYVGWDFITIWNIHPTINDGYPSFTAFVEPEYQKGTSGDLLDFIFNFGTEDTPLWFRFLLSFVIIMIILIPISYYLNELHNKGK